MQLGLSTVAESVTVSGAAPVVDVSTTSGSTLLTNDMLQLTATSRNSVMSVLTLAPGVRTFTDVGGGQMMLENPASRAYGVGGSQWYTVDGVQNFRLGTTLLGLQHVRRGARPERGRGCGAADARRPGHGRREVRRERFPRRRVLGRDEQQLSGQQHRSGVGGRRITSGDALDSQYDLSGELGGRIIRNKLWFYSSARKRRAAYDVLNNFQPDGSPGQTINKQRILTNKVSFQATPGNRFIFMNMWEHGEEQKGLSELVRYEAREFKTNDRPNTKIEWEGVRGSSLIANLQFGHSRQDWDVSVPQHAAACRIQRPRHRSGRRRQRGRRGDAAGPASITPPAV